MLEFKDGKFSLSALIVDTGKNRELIVILQIIMRDTTTIIIITDVHGTLFRC